MAGQEQPAGTITSKVCRPAPARVEAVGARTRRAPYENREDIDGDQWARAKSADHLSISIADHLGLAFEETRDTIAKLHPNMIGLFDTPQGWSALAEMVALMARAEPPSRHFAPTVQ